MFGINLKSNKTCEVKGFDLFEQHTEQFMEWADVETIANDIVIAAITEAQRSGVYVTLTGMQKKYNRVIEQGVWGGLV